MDCGGIGKEPGGERYFRQHYSHAFCQWVGFGSCGRACRLSSSCLSFDLFPIPIPILINISLQRIEKMASDSTGFWLGTFVYIALGLAACAISASPCLTSRMKGQVGLSVILITIATICMWMMWAMTWLMQWHPIIRPEKETEN